MSSNLSDAKHTLRQQLNSQLGAVDPTGPQCWEIDARWADTEDPRFTQAREIEERIIAGCEDEAVSEAAIRGLCMQMAMLYLAAKTEQSVSLPRK